MDAWLRRLYDKHPVQYALFALVIGVVEATVLGVMHDVYFGSVIYGVSFKQGLVVFALGEGGLAVAGLVTLVLCWGPLVDLTRWLTGNPRTPELARAVLASMPSFARRFTLTFVIAAVFTALVPGQVFLLQQAHSLDAWNLLLTLVAGGGPIIYTGVFVWFFLEFMLRRILADAARWIADPPERPRSSGLGIGGKLTLGLAASTAGSAEFVTALWQTRGSGSTGMLNIVGLTVLAAVPYLLTTALAVALMVLAPVRELIRATRAVAQGNYGVRVPVTTEDEFGLLTTTFNAMVEGLQERERLRGDNEGLVRDLMASRARVVEAADAERRRIERNIHDGAQQQLVAVTLDLRMLQENLASLDSSELGGAVSEAAENLKTALADLRELARGLHPSILTTDGLSAALKQLCDRSPVPISIEAPTQRYPEQVETAVYFVAAEALANVAKYAQATAASVKVSAVDHSLTVTVADDGVGGADVANGSGLLGLSDRIGAVGGRLRVTSPRGAGTEVSAVIPLHAA